MEAITSMCNSKIVKCEKSKIKKITNRYKYISNNPFKNILAFVNYRVFAKHLANFYVKCVKQVKYKNKDLLKLCKDRGYFVYANRLNNQLDCFIPHIACYPHKTYTLVDSNQTSKVLLGNFGNSLGVMPIPTELSGSRKFLNAIEKRIVEGDTVLIYPETKESCCGAGIKPFDATSFKYPVKFYDPSYCITTTKQKIDNKERIIVYVDGPFYPNRQVNEKESQEDLRNRIYKTMLNRLEKGDNYEL